MSRPTDASYEQRFVNLFLASVSGWKVAEVVSRLGVGKNTYLNYKSGRWTELGIKAREAMVGRLAEARRIDPTWIWGDDLPEDAGTFKPAVRHRRPSSGAASTPARGQRAKQAIRTLEDTSKWEKAAGKAGLPSLADRLEWAFLKQQREDWEESEVRELAVWVADLYAGREPRDEQCQRSSGPETGGDPAGRAKKRAAGSGKG